MVLLDINLIVKELMVLLTIKSKDYLTEPDFKVINSSSELILKLVIILLKLLELIK